MVPITDSELQYKLAHDANALLELFADHDLSQVINEARPSLV